METTYIDSHRYMSINLQHQNASVWGAIQQRSSFKTFVHIRLRLDSVHTLTCLWSTYSTYLALSENDTYPSMAILIGKWWSMSTIYQLIWVKVKMRSDSPAENAAAHLCTVRLRGWNERVPVCEDFSDLLWRSFILGRLTHVDPFNMVISLC